MAAASGAQGLPNGRFYFDGGSENREVDAPPRLGHTLVAVQTRAQNVDPGTNEGGSSGIEARSHKWSPIAPMKGRYNAP